MEFHLLLSLLCITQSQKLVFHYFVVCGLIFARDYKEWCGWLFVFDCFFSDGYKDSLCVAIWFVSTKFWPLCYAEWYIINRMQKLNKHMVHQPITSKHDSKIINMVGMMQSPTSQWLGNSGLTIPELTIPVLVTIEL